MNKKYWIIGGIIGSIIIALNILVIGPFGPLGNLLSLTRSFVDDFYILSTPPDSVSFISYVLTGFVFGAIIGLIYGKIRRRKQVGMTMN